MIDKSKRPAPTTGEGVLGNYETLVGWDPFEDAAGPMYESRKGIEPRRCAMVIEPKHCNTSGIVHGGLLMTFADYSTFALAREAIGPNGGVTISMTSDFTSAARADDLLEASVEVVKSTRSMVFVQGRIGVGEATVMSFSAVLKKLRG
jgi:acyl-coenzyme A thioesterase 13